MLFIDYSLVFNTKLITKLEALGLNPTLYNWVLDFLTGRPQVVKGGINTSTSLILNTGAPQGCVLGPLLFSMFTHDCMAEHASNSISKFADATTVVGLITNNDETAYREVVWALAERCQGNNLSLNVTKMKELTWTSGNSRGSTPPNKSTRPYISIFLNSIILLLDLCVLLDITALLELGTHALRNTCNNIG